MVVRTSQAMVIATFYHPMEEQAIQKVQNLMDKLKAFFVEREDIIEAMFISLLCRQHAIFIGPPGTAKSGLIYGLTKSVQDFRIFYYLLNKFTLPEEVLGPVMISKLEHDEFERKIESKLPDAEIGFIDEVFNGNSSILNSLNSIMNERIFYNGSQAVKVPLECLFGATNFMPEETNLVAFFDRFLFRFLIEYIQKDENFRTMLENNLQHTEFKVNPQEMLTQAEVHLLQTKVSKVKFPVMDKVIEIRTNLRKEQIEPSDRRFAWALSALQASAVIHGRESVTEDDLYILENILWSDKKEVGVVISTILKTINPAIARVQEQSKMGRNIEDSIKKKDPDKDKEKFLEAYKKLNEIRKTIEETKTKGFFGDKETHAIELILSENASARKEILHKLGMDE